MSVGHNLVLTGFMGTGKTIVGRELAKKLGMEFVDTDEMIEARHGRIASIFAEQGEARFRELERAVAKELSGRKGILIATGGRMILDPVNFKELSRNGRIFCLVATPDEIHRRVVDDEAPSMRPLLHVDDPRERIAELMAERDRDYRRFPQVTTDHASPGVIADELAELWHGPVSHHIEGPDGGCTVTVGAGILPLVGQLASIHGPVALVTDEAGAELYEASLGDLDATVVLPTGRSGRTIESVQEVCRQLLAAGVDRSATIVSLGTRDVGDVAGFAAATYLRGLDLVHCPTDLIAMVETTVGGEVGLDVPPDGSLIGLRKQPKAVLADVGTLQTLTDRDFTSGLAEVIKLGLIASSSLLDRIGKVSWAGTDRLLPGCLSAMQSLVAEAIQVEIAIVQGDPSQEAGRRTVLDLGHDVGYGIEQASGGEIGHGEAVAMGLVAAARLSELMGHAERDLAGRVETIVDHVGLVPVLPASIEVEAIVKGMHHYEARLGSPGFVLLRDVGDPFVTGQVPPSALSTVLEGMRDRRATNPATLRG
jgi:shikimate kinase/3-dehydroquinate synthase